MVQAVRAPVPGALVDRGRPAAHRRRRRAAARDAGGTRPDAGRVHLPRGVPAARYARRVTAEGHPPATTAEPDERTRVSTLELFFDLVFVFTITQLTQLYADRLDRVGSIRVLVMLIVIWWM